MARTWFGEIGLCCCLPPLLNLPTAFSEPRANHKRAPNTILSYGEFDVFFERPSKIQTRVRPEMPLLSPSPFMLVPLDLWATLACTRTRAHVLVWMIFQVPDRFPNHDLNRVRTARDLY